MFTIQRFHLVSVFAIGITVAANTGCTPKTAAPPTPPPPAQTSDQIEQVVSEADRLAAEAQKAEEEKTRRIQRNRDAVNDLMFLGMTLAEANEALGIPGVKGLSIGSGEKQQQAFEWTLEGDITIKATFVNGKLDKKEMVE